MVDNIQGSEFYVNRQITQQRLETLLNNNKLQSNNPYSNLPIQDQTEISEEAQTLFEKSNEIDYYKELLKSTDEDESLSKVELIKAQLANGTFELPSNDQIAEALLGDSDFRSFMGF